MNSDTHTILHKSINKWHCTYTTDDTHTKTWHAEPTVLNSVSILSTEKTLVQCRG